MNAFTADWLRLREAADVAARSSPDAKALARSFAAAARGGRDRGLVKLVDLAGGAGANVRFLALQVPGSQAWTVADADADLLAALDAESRAWARRVSWQVRDRGDSLELGSLQRVIRIAGRQHDLTDLENLGLACDGVTASALLDLVSAAWLDALVAKVAAAGIPALFALTVDGRADWTPAREDDGAVMDAFWRDMARDKGFGPALGPSAVAYAETAFRHAGYVVETASSDWHLSAGPLLTAVVDGISSVVGADAWAAARRAQEGNETLALTLGHTDLLALPG